MLRFASAFRIAIGMVCLALCVRLAGYALGLGHNPAKETMRRRVELCEILVINCSLLATLDDPARLQQMIDAVVGRNSDVLSAGLRRGNKLLVEAGDHSAHWLQNGKSSSDTHMSLPVLTGSERWGFVELRFRPLDTNYWSNLWKTPGLLELAFFGGVTLLAFALYLQGMLTHLDPARVIPDRVRAALDTLAEGLLVLDQDERIVLANRSIASTLRQKAESLQGLSVDELGWMFPEEYESGLPPWTQSMRDRETISGTVLNLEVQPGKTRTYRVNASPIIATNGTVRGVLASFDDITQLEKRKIQLTQMLRQLSESREQIRKQNDDLRILATRDPLTRCMNRRAFFQQVEEIWSTYKRDGLEMCCIMLDIDHFKSINDNYGHSMGDDVLSGIAETLQTLSRDSALVCRYGGEEFTIMVPDVTMSEGFGIAEAYRQALAALEFSKLNITASLGVASIKDGAATPQILIDQADKCLFVAKRKGRNQVQRWDRIDRDAILDESLMPGTLEETAENAKKRVTSAVPYPEDVSIPFHAVTALTSALAFRDLGTAEHSRRVADLCVDTASGIMSVRDAYIMETAALLHDIGKIGVPDAVLNKSGTLTDDEWKIMSVHDRIGVEILKSTFNCEPLLEIIKTYHAWYDGSRMDRDLPKGKQIPLIARILTIADAYDAMVSDRVYRCGVSQAEAIHELRQCAGQQFDPEMVELFVSKLADNRFKMIHEPNISKQAALRIGLQIERIVDSMDRQDMHELADLALQLRSTASDSGAQEIAEVAGRLEDAALEENSEFDQLVDTARELLDLCRDTQRAYLSVEQHSIRARPTSSIVDQFSA